MKKSSKEKIEKLLFYIFDKFILSIDRYKNNGSLWVINTEKQNWILEFTENNTLWYNYQFFEKKMRLCNLDCVDNKDLIQKWFESRYLNINQVKQTELSKRDFFPEDIFQNRVKDTHYDQCRCNVFVVDTIQNGVKHTKHHVGLNRFVVEDTIQNGVKHTRDVWLELKDYVEDTIQNGVKQICNLSFSQPEIVKSAIQDGVKDTKGGRYVTRDKIKKTIECGVKYVNQEIHHRNREVISIIKKTQPVYHRPETSVNNVIKKNKII
jgi:hypothetical protein